MKKLLIILILLSLATPAHAVVTHHTVTSASAFSIGDAYRFWPVPPPTYGWDLVNYYIGDDGAAGYTDRPLINFNIATPSINAQVKSVAMKLTSGINWDAKRLTSLYVNTDDAETVYNAIGSATAYVTNQTDGGYRDLGANAVTQMETAGWLSTDHFAVGVMETGENAAGEVTDWELQTKFYYPPAESDQWEVNETYPIGKTTGVGTAPVNGDMHVTATGDLQLKGDTSLQWAGGATKRITVDAGGKIQLANTSSIKL